MISSLSYTSLVCCPSQSISKPWTAPTCIRQTRYCSSNCEPHVARLAGPTRHDNPTTPTAAAPPLRGARAQPVGVFAEESRAMSARLRLRDDARLRVHYCDET